MTWTFCSFIMPHNVPYFFLGKTAIRLKLSSKDRDLNSTASSLTPKSFVRNYAYVEIDGNKDGG